MEINEEVVVSAYGEAMAQKGWSLLILFMPKANALMIIFIKDGDQ